MAGRFPTITGMVLEGPRVRRVGVDELETALRELEAAVAALRTVRGRYDERARGALEAASARLARARDLVDESLRSLA